MIGRMAQEENCAERNVVLFGKSHKETGKNKNEQGVKG